MLVACRLAGLSALEAHYAGVRARAQCGADAGKARRGASAHSWAANLPEACPEPPGRLGGKGERATCDSLSQVPRQDAPPGVRSLTSAEGTRTRRASKWNPDRPVPCWGL